jgi:hypothetical protein
VEQKVQHDVLNIEVQKGEEEEDVLEEGEDEEEVQKGEAEQ